MAALLFPLVLRRTNSNCKRVVYFTSPWGRKACLEAILSKQGFRD